VKIITSYDFPPISDRRFDWSAYQDGWEPGLPLGHGPTREAAIADLLEQLEDQKDAGRD
jgi:hypothetical protein